MERRISVTGHGSVKARPDTVELAMTVRGEGKAYADAEKMAAERYSAIAQALVLCGIAAGDVRTAGYDVETAYEDVRDKQGMSRRIAKGYTCDHRLSVCFGLDMKLLGAVLEAISASGASPELSIAFTVRDSAKLELEALAAAAREARSRAEALAAAMGERLGALVSVSDADRGRAAPGVVMMRCAPPKMAPDDVECHQEATLVWLLEN